MTRPIAASCSRCLGLRHGCFVLLLLCAFFSAATLQRADPDRRGRRPQAGRADRQRARHRRRGADRRRRPAGRRAPSPTAWSADLAAAGAQVLTVVERRAAATPAKRCRSSPPRAARLGRHRLQPSHRRVARLRRPRGRLSRARRAAGRHAAQLPLAEFPQVRQPAEHRQPDRRHRHRRHRHDDGHHHRRHRPVGRQPDRPVGGAGRALHPRLRRRRAGVDRRA